MTLQGRRRRTIKPVLKEIQALRAVAVGLVVTYHVWPEWLRGGFLGVDIFFSLISGYLIGSHLLREVQLGGQVSLTRFWVRRIKRILPAAFLVLLASVVITVVALPETVWVNTLLQISASAVYFVNWVLAWQSVDYLVGSAARAVVQHFWTLSVEEQFYLGWPFLLVFTLLLFGRSTQGRRLGVRARLIVVVLLAGTAIAASFGYSVYITGFASGLAYFSTFAHAWEFGVGVSGLDRRLSPALLRQAAEHDGGDSLGWSRCSAWG